MHCEFTEGIISYFVTTYTYIGHRLGTSAIHWCLPDSAAIHNLMCFVC